MKKYILSIIIFCFLAFRIFASAKIIAISDFEVHSDNPQYKYMGKGISEMISVELQQSPSIEIIEREKRAELLHEMNIVLAGLADPDTQLEVGKLLIASYIIFGEIFDMGKEVVITIRMIEVESGEVIWSDKLVEQLSKYDKISAYFAVSVQGYFNVQVPESTLTKSIEAEAKSEEVVIAFSNALDHYDNNEEEQAKKELKRAIKIDPDSDAVKIYLNKLLSISPKFNVELIYYAPRSLSLFNSL